MAIDTALRRASVIATALSVMLLPPPSGTVDLGARAMLDGAYAGFAYGVVADTSGTRRMRQTPAFTRKQRRRRR